MPRPRTESAARTPSPVHAKMIDGFVGSRTRQWTSQVGLSGSVHDDPPSTVFHTPPETLPARMVFGVAGSGEIARTRPPILPGPRESHVVELEIPASSGK